MFLLQLLFTPGLAEYLAILNIYEFLVPKISSSVVDLVVRAVSQDLSSVNSFGGHPKCMLRFKSKGVLKVSADDTELEANLKASTIENIFLGIFEAIYVSLDIICF